MGELWIHNKTPRHIRNQPVYYFVVRCVTFTMQTETPMSAWTVHFLPGGSYMENQVIIRLFGEYGIQKKGRLISGPIPHPWNWSTPSHHRDSPAFSLLTLPSPLCSGWWALAACPAALPPASLVYHSSAQWFLLFPHCYWQLRFWKGHITCSHVAITRHINPIRMLSQTHSIQVLPDNMLCKGSSHFH